MLSILCFIQFSNRQCAIVFDWKLQMKSERKPIKVWPLYIPTSFSQYIPTSFSQYAWENIFSLKSVPLLHGVDVSEYSEYGFECNFWDVRQWVTQSVISYYDLPRSSSPPGMVCVPSLLFFLLVCLALKFTDIVLYRGGTKWSFMIKVLIYGCRENDPWPLILKEQIEHLWSTYIT